MTSNSNSWQQEYYDNIIQDPISHAAEYQTLMQLRKEYGDTISKEDYIAKLDELSNTVVKEWENDLEYFTEYGDGTIVVEEKGETNKRCGWCGLEMSSNSLSELCSSCNKLPKKIAVDGPFTDGKVYVRNNKQAPRGVDVFKSSELKFDLKERLNII
jgi:hypothetical protein